VEQVTEERRSIRKRTAKIALWLFGTAAFLLAALAAADVIHWHRFNLKYLQSAELNTFPKPLPDSSASVAQGVTTVTQSGCSVDLPWPNATVKVNGLAVLPDKRVIFFEDPASAVDKAGIFRATEDGHSAVKLMGASTLQSNYDLLSAELNVDPAEFIPVALGSQSRSNALPGYLQVVYGLLQTRAHLYRGDGGRPRIPVWRQQPEPASH
jgi:hypothetical protein